MNIKELLNTGGIFCGTNGCLKNRFTTACYLLSCLAKKYNIIIERLVWDPCYRKGQVDEINDVNKPQV